MNYNKVIFVCDYKAKYGGNFLSSFSYLGHHLLKNNIQVYFIFPRDAKNQKWEVNLSDFHVIYSCFEPTKLISAISRCLQQKDLAIIHLNFLSSLFLIKLKRQIGKQAKFVFQQHMAVNFGIKQIIKGLLLRVLVPNDVAYIGVSPEVYKDVRREVGPKKSYLVTNAIDTNRLKPFYTQNNSNILIFGTDFKRKGVDLAIKAIYCSKVKDQCHLIIVTHNKKDAVNLIMNEFDTIPDFVQIVEPAQNVRKLYNKSFLFLSPSRLEAFGYAVVEAAYSGTQVIASNVLGQNVLGDIPGVVMVPSEDISSLRTQINNAFDRKNDNREQINVSARHYIDEHFSLESWATSILSIYKTI